MVGREAWGLVEALVEPARQREGGLRKGQQKYFSCCTLSLATQRVNLRLSLKRRYKILSAKELIPRTFLIFLSQSCLIAVAQYPTELLGMKKAFPLLAIAV